MTKILHQQFLLRFSIYASAFKWNYYTCVCFEESPEVCHPCLLRTCLPMQGLGLKRILEVECRAAFSLDNVELQNQWLADHSGG